jgi:uncharacterized protein YkwD
MLTIMKNTKFILFALIFSTLTLTSCSSDSESVSPTVTESQKSYSHNSTELELLDLINTYRVDNNLNPLEIIEHISYKSEEHNDYMISTNTVNHDGFTQRKTNLQQVLGAYRVGENVAFGFSTPQATLDAWVASAGHKANLEGDYTHYGVSIRIDNNGRKYYTNMFIKK